MICCNIFHFLVFQLAQVPRQKLPLGERILEEAGAVVLAERRISALTDNLRPSIFTTISQHQGDDDEEAAYQEHSKEE